MITDKSLTTGNTEDSEKGLTFSCFVSVFSVLIFRL